MNAPDLSPLIKGIIPLVGIAIVLGQFGRLEQWARSQAFEAIAWKEPLPYFFAPVHGASRKAKSHAHASANRRVPGQQPGHAAE